MTHFLRLAVAAVALLAVMALPGVVAGHAQLVSSTPGSGELVATAPTEARLVFSEPAEPRFTNVDLLDGRGKVIVLGLGQLEPADPRQLVVPLPPLADGAYSLSWRAVSAADGHSTSGFVTFAIGDTALPPGLGSYDPGSSGDIHSGHGGTTALAETQGRAASYLGFMLAFGFLLIGFGVLVPVIGSVPPGLVYTQAAGLLVAGLGSGLLGLVGGEAFASADSAATSALGSLAYLLESRIGLLLLGRILVALVLAVAVFLLARSRPRLGLVLGGIGGLAGIGLTVAGSHAAAFSSIAPVIAQGVHVAAAAVWLSGVVVLAGGIAVGLFVRDQLGRIVRRFSAAALVAVGLVSTTAIYAVWLETGQLFSLESGYSTVLAVKIALFVAAIGIGALTYLDRPRALIARLPFASRVSVEAVLGVCVVVATALLASGSPPAGVRPIDIAPSAADAAATGLAGDTTLGIQPARPGPNRFTVGLGLEPPEGAKVELRLQRLDADQGINSIALTISSGSPPQYGASGGALPSNSRWDATVIVTDRAGHERSRRRFAFALDATGISEGRRAPPLDPALVVALALIALGVLGLSYALAGGRLPRTEPAASRISLLVGGAVALVVGVVMTVGGPHP